jgi:hypothetical protein
MADTYGKQGIRNLDLGDISAGVINSDNITRIDPATEGGNLADIKARIGALSSPVTGTTNELLRRIVAALSSGGTDISDYDKKTINAADGPTDYVYTCTADTVLNSVVCSATVYATFLVSIDPDGVSGYTSHWMGITSESSPSIVIKCEGYKVLTNGLIKITKTNYNMGVTKYDVHSTFNMQQ